jgi:hypothetical protein
MRTAKIVVRQVTTFFIDFGPSRGLRYHSTATLAQSHQRKQAGSISQPGKSLFIVMRELRE